MIYCVFLVIAAATHVIPARSLAEVYCCCTTNLKKVKVSSHKSKVVSNLNIQNITDIFIKQTVAAKSYDTKITQIHQSNQKKSKNYLIWTFHHRRLWSRVEVCDCSGPAVPAALYREFTRMGCPLTARAGAGVFPPLTTPGWDPWASIWPPAFAQTGMLVGNVGQGATAGPAHWFPIRPCWPQGTAVGEYGGEEYGEPPFGCWGKMERIWEVESFGCGDSESRLDKWKKTKHGEED